MPRQFSPLSFLTLLALCTISASVLSAPLPPQQHPSGQPTENPKMEPAPDRSRQLSPIEKLGQAIFRDPDLSIERNQACINCHAPETGFTAPFEQINERGSVMEGSIAGRFGHSKPPSIGYVSFAPILHHRLEGEEGEADDPLFIGGNFSNGRATGKRLGSPTADQALHPFLDPLEMALPDPACVVKRVCDPADKTAYTVTFTDVWGADACKIDWPEKLEAKCNIPGAKIEFDKGTRGRKAREAVNRAYQRIALSLLAFQSSPKVNAFSSKFDAYQAGKVKLTAQEALGLQLFEGKAKCSACHVLTPAAPGKPAVFTDFSYDNLGVPRNPDNPFYQQRQYNKLGAKWVDRGLAGTLAADPLYKNFARSQLGKVKVPTLRNVDKRPEPGFVKAYMHNGYFKTLKDVVHFYNTRDVKPRCPNPMTRAADALKMNCWPAPEIAENVNKDELGDLKLSPSEEDALVAFMKTLSDGYQAPQ